MILGLAVRPEGVVNGFNDFGAAVVNGGDTLSNGGPALNEDVPAAAPTTLSSLPPQQQAAMRAAATPTPPPSFQREEPAKIRIWREQQKDRLEKKGESLRRLASFYHCHFQTPKRRRKSRSGARRPNAN